MGRVERVWICHLVKLYYIINDPSHKWFPRSRVVENFNVCESHRFLENTLAQISRNKVSCERMDRELCCLVFEYISLSNKCFALALRELGTLKITLCVGTENYKTNKFEALVTQRCARKKYLFPMLLLVFLWLRVFSFGAAVLAKLWSASAIPQPTFNQDLDNTHRSN